MPRLARLRLVGIGYPDARFDDLTLDFRDGYHRASDAVIWLRNGGGKSSILNLFFALLRPHKQKFLGGSTGGGAPRELEHYVLKDDHAVIVAEWELDDVSQTRRSSRKAAPGPALAGFGDLALENGKMLVGPPRYLTGAFYERTAAHRADAGKLQTLYFSTHVVPDKPAFTLEDLPLSYEHANGKRFRRSMDSFKQEWHNQGLGWSGPPPREVKDNQTEWARILNEARLDPDLFEYQLKMNQAEGGADNLFRFGSSEAFVDFFVKLILDPELSRRVASNLGSFRDLLNRLSSRLVPEREFIDGVLKRLEPLAALHLTRRVLHQRSWQVRETWHKLFRLCEDRSAVLSRQVADEQAIIDNAELLAGHARETAWMLRRQAATWMHHAQARRDHLLMAAIAQAKGKTAAAERASAIWKAAVPLRDAIQHAQARLDQEQRLERLRAEHAPLLADVRAAAGRYARAIRRHVIHLRSEQEKHRQLERTLRQDSTRQRNSASEHQSQAATLDARVAELDRLIRETGRARQRLETAGALQAAEPLSTAIARWETARDSKRASEERATDELGRLRTLLAEGRVALTSATGERLAVESALAALQAELTAAEAGRHSLENHPQLQRCLERDSLDLEAVDPNATISLVRELIAKLQTAALALRAELAAEQRAIDSLTATNLLPPEPDVERVCHTLEQLKIRAWPGWEFLSKNRTHDEGRAFISGAPEIADGVVVDSEHWARAIEQLPPAVAGLDRPVVLAPRSALSKPYPVQTQEPTLPGSALPARLVVGPDSDASFDPSVGQVELGIRQVRAGVQTADLEKRDAELADLGQLAAELRAFREHYPYGWFATQRLHEQTLIDRATAETMREAELAMRISSFAEAITAQEAAREECRHAHSEATGFFRRLEDFLSAYGPDSEIHVQERLSALASATAARAAVERERVAAEESDLQADRATREAAAAGERAKEEEGRLGNISHLDSAAADEPTGERAELLPDIDSLSRHYLDLAAEYEGLIGTDAAGALQRQAAENETNARRRFQRVLDESPGLDERTVRDTLAELADQSDAESRRDDAVAAAARAAFHEEKLRNEKKEAAGRLEKLGKEYTRDHGGLPQGAPDWQGRPDASPEEIEAAAEEKAAAAEGHHQIHEQQHAAAVRASTRKAEAAQKVERYAGYQSQLCMLQDSGRRILETASADEHAAATTVDGLPASNDDQMAELIPDFAQKWMSLNQEIGECDGTRDRLARELHQWLNEFSSGSGYLQSATELKMVGVEVLESTAASLVTRFTLRTKTLQAEIQSVEEHRSQVAGVLLDAALNAIATLRTAERVSRLPDGLGALSKESFLQIKMEMPGTRGAQFERIHPVIQEIIAPHVAMPDGVTLVQRAVQHLLQPIKVRILFPDQDLPAHTVPVENLAQKSGGERLTCAVLLYCVLARLRAQRRGAGDRHGGVLVLDNPVGTASRPKFIRLQRAAARAMGVQLLYTTGVQDLEALREFPVTVRLRNDRRDRRTDQRVVELDIRPKADQDDTRPLSPSAISAARLVRSEESVIPISPADVSEAIGQPGT